MDWTVEFAVSAQRDLGLIFDHLVDSYMYLGDPMYEAFDKAEKRIEYIQDQAGRIGTAPYRGETHDDMLRGLRHLTLDQAVYWFDTDALECRVRILAIFYGGQDNQRRMLLRLLGDN